VASIANNIVNHLRHTANLPSIKINELLPSDALINSVCLLHDIGHPPFGHGGEAALNYALQDHGGFESNGQSLRLITKVEPSYAPFGLDLTKRVLLGIIKYPQSYSKLHKYQPYPKKNKYRIHLADYFPPKCYLDSEQDILHWLLANISNREREIFGELAIEPNYKQHGITKYRSIDCSIMDIADDIAYGVHDLEDVIHLKFIDYSNFKKIKFNELLNTAFDETQLINKNKDLLLERLLGNNIAEQKHAIGDLVNGFIANCKIVIANENFISPILKYNVILKSPAKKLLTALKGIVYDHVIDSYTARTIEYGGQTVILHLFDALFSNPELLLTPHNRNRYANCANKSQGLRIICDEIAGMSETYAHKMHQRLFGFSTKTPFHAL